MDYKAFFTAANNVVQTLDSQPTCHASADVLASIRNQMIFIRDNAALSKNPSTALPLNTKFTYAVSAARELASPDEFTLQVQIDKVAGILIGA